MYLKSVLAKGQMARLRCKYLSSSGVCSASRLRSTADTGRTFRITDMKVNSICLTYLG